MGLVTVIVGLCVLRCGAPPDEVSASRGAQGEDATDAPDPADAGDVLQLPALHPAFELEASALQMRQAGQAWPVYPATGNAYFTRVTNVRGAFQLRSRSAWVKEERQLSIESKRERGERRAQSCHDAVREAIFDVFSDYPGVFDQLAEQGLTITLWTTRDARNETDGVPDVNVPNVLGLSGTHHIFLYVGDGINEWWDDADEDDFFALVHEIGHTLMLQAPDSVLTSAAVRAAYEESVIEDGLWDQCQDSCYAATNHYEYFAEGVAMWFGFGKRQNSRYPKSRSDLRRYDRRLYNLLDTLFESYEPN